MRKRIINYDHLFIGKKICKHCMSDLPIDEYRIRKKWYKTSCYLTRNAFCTLCEKKYLLKYVK